MSDRANSLLPSLSLKRPITVAMILLSLLVVGGIATVFIPIALFPDDFENPQLYIGVSYPNSNPMDTEEKITKPIEASLGTVPNIKRVYTDTYDSYVRVRIQFHKGADLSEAYANVSDRMERIMPEMPDEVKRIGIYKHDATDIPVIWTAMTYGEEAMDVDYLAERYVLPAFQRISGVGNVEINGIRGREIRVELDHDKLKAHNISVTALAQSLADQNFNLSAGTIVEAESERFVRSVGRLRNIAEFEAIIIDAKSNLRLADVATIAFRPQENWNVFSLEREKSYGISFSRSSGANMVEVCQAIEATMRELEAQAEFKSLKFHIFWNQGDHVTESIDNLLQSGLWGGLFSVIVLFIYLRSIRLTLTITLAIPLSLLSSVIGLYFLGWSLNMATMMGLLLSVGLVVDNSIVIVENIQIKRLLGSNPTEAALKGSSEMGLAITLATLTTIVVFLPLILMGDGNEMQFWLLRIGVPVMFSLTASLIIALLLIPLATKIFADKSDLSQTRIGKSRASIRYSKILRWTIEHRSYVSIMLIALLALSYEIPFKEIKQNASGGGTQNVNLRYEFPGGQSLEEITDYLSTVFDYIETKQSVYNYETYSSFSTSTFANVELQLNNETKPWYINAYQIIGEGLGLSQSPYLTRKEIIEDLRENIVISPGSRLRFSYNEQDPTKSFNIALYGDDTKTLQSLSKEVERRLRSIDGLIAVETEEDVRRQELNLTIDREKALRFGIDTRQISGIVSHTIRGNEVGYFYDSNGRQTRIRIWLDEEDRQTVDQLRKTVFQAEDGSQVPLESLVSLSYDNGSNTIHRQDRKTVLRIKGIANEDDSKELFKQTDAVMQDFVMPRGYRWDKGGQYQQMQESNEAFTFTLIMIVVFIILLMGAMFESFLLPFCVFLTMPLAAVGVVWTLYLTNTPFNIMASIGIIILLGVVVNNGIVLIDLVTRLRADGLSRTDAIMEAGQRRFRPIWMTSLTTIFGMIPMSLGDTKMIDLSYSPLGRAIMGGMLTSTILTLLIVPLFYTLFDDLRIRFFGYIRMIFAKGKQNEKTPATLTQTGE